MKKTILFILSVSIALGITYYTKKEQSAQLVQARPEWKTFVKTSEKQIAAHKTTNEEFKAAKIPPPPDNNPADNSPNRPKLSRSPSSVNPLKGFMVRNGRILMGEIDQKYEDEDYDLKMVNTINPNWKDIMGSDLMRFQPQETKLMVKEEVPVIKIENGYGRFLQQVTITYLQASGDRSSFKALVDSSNGSVVETWDRTIHEKIKKDQGGFLLPAINESGIVTR